MTAPFDKLRVRGVSQSLMLSLSKHEGDVNQRCAP